MEFVRPVDFDGATVSLPGGYRGQFLYHGESCCVIATRVPPGVAGPANHVHPVVWIEFDNHPGIFLDNDEPEPFHVHTIVRTPNGNDYGMDLLRQHYERFHAGAPNVP